jgi:peptidoglycan DL-endopeptidase CwlO
MRLLGCWEQRQGRRVLATTCTLAAAAVLALGQAAAAPGRPATPSTTTAADAVATKQAEASKIALTLQDQGRRLSRLAEDYDRARVNADRIAAQIADTKATIASTDRQLQAQHAVVLRQAIADYVLGGQTAYLALSGGSKGAGFDDLGRRHAYATTVASAKYDALRELRRLRHQMDQSRSLLATQQRAANNDVARIGADRQAASAAAASLQATLDKVKGDLAALVAAQQARLASQQRARVLAALAAKRVSLPPTQAVALAQPAPSPPPAPRPPVPPTTSPPHATTTTLPPPQPPPPPGGNHPARGWQIAIAAAVAELGKPYQWGGAGPNSFDCSGLTMWSWAKAGVGLMHLAQAQYAATRPVAISDLLPGDLVFYGTPSNVHHVGIYVGGGSMIEAPETGDVVKYSTIYFDGLLAGGRIID